MWLDRKHFLQHMLAVDLLTSIPSKYKYIYIYIYWNSKKNSNAASHHINFLSFFHLLLFYKKEKRERRHAVIRVLEMVCWHAPTTLAIINLLDVLLDEEPVHVGLVVLHSKPHPCILLQLLRLVSDTSLRHRRSAGRGAVEPDGLVL